MGLYKTKLNSDYIRERYHRYNLNVPKDEWDRWVKAAEKANMPVGTWIKALINEVVNSTEEKPTD